MRPMWSGHIAFGLISIPISLTSAIEASERISFRLLHRKDRAPIKFKKFCSKENVEVDNDEIVRGFQTAKGRFALVEKEELEKAAEEAIGEDEEGAVQVLEFVPAESLDPVSLDHPYFVLPRKGGERAYAVLRAALSESDRVGVARLPLRGRPTLAALLPEPRVIALVTLRPFEELRDPQELSLPASRVNAGEVKMAKLLIDQLSSEGWKPAEHPSAYHRALRRLLSAKTPFDLKAVAPEKREKENVIDLMSALRQSLDRAREKPRRAVSRRRGAA